MNAPPALVVRSLIIIRNSGIYRQNLKIFLDKAIKAVRGRHAVH